MNPYLKRFSKILEQDEDLTDAQALDAELQDITASELGAESPPTGAPSITGQQKEMYDKLRDWIQKLDEFAEYLNGTTGSVQTALNGAESDTIFDSISNSETKKIARVAMEVSSLNEILKGYLAGASDPKYRFN